MSEAVLIFVETKAEEQRGLLCQWVEAFYEAGRRVQVVADSTTAARNLDQLLWSFSQPSFIPHCILPPRGDVASLIEPVVITIGETACAGMDVVVGDVPLGLDFMANYPASLHFILLDDEERRQQSRLLWQSARDRGFRLDHRRYGAAVRLAS